jgi:hypothetical protein
VPPASPVRKIKTSARRLISDREAAENLWGYVVAVGEELRGRILHKGKRKFVTLAAVSPS